MRRLAVPDAAVRAWPLAVFALVIAALLGPALTGQRTVLPHDLLLERQPWAAGVQPVNPELRDLIDTYYPVQHELLGRVRDGRRSAWLHDQGIGMPGASFVGYGAASPFNLPALVLPFDVAWSWAMALRLLVAMAGAYLLTRAFGVGRAVGVIAGIAYGLSGYMALWLGWPQTHVGAFIPWTLWAARLTAARQAPWWAGPALALSVTGLLLGGFPAVAGYTLIAAGVVTLHTVWARRADGGTAVLRALGACALAVVLGVALAAVVLAPSTRILEEFALGYREQAWRTTIPRHALLTLLVPGLFGDVVHDRMWIGVSYVEAVGYAGIVTLLLAIPAWVLTPRRPGLGLWSGLALGWLAFVHAVPPLRHILSVLPMLSGNVPTRAIVLVGLSLAIVGAFGGDALLRWLRGEATVSRAAVRVLAGIVAAGLLVAVAARNWLRDVAYTRLAEHHVPGAAEVMVRETAAAAGLVALAVVAVLAGWWWARRNPRTGAGIAAGGLVLVVAWDLLAFAGGWNVQVPRASLFPDAPGIDELVAASARHRVAGSDAAGLPSTHLEYGFADARAHTFTTPRFEQVLARLGARRESPTNWDFQAAGSGRWEPWLGVLGVRTVLTAEPVDRLGALLVQPVERAPVGPLWSGYGVAAEVAGPRDGALDGALVRVGTYQRENAGTLTVRVVAESGVFTGEVDVDELVDLAWATIPVGPVPVREGEPLRVEVGGTAPADTLGVTVFGVPETLEAEGRPALALHYADAHLPWRPVAGSQTLRLVELPGALPVVHATAGAHAVATGEALAAVETLGLDGLAGTTVVEPYGDAALPQLPPGAGSIRVLDWERDGGVVRATVASEHGGVLVTLDQALAGWRATVDGREAPVVIANHLFVATVVPPGEVTVELRYTAPRLRTGQAVSVLALLILGAWAWLRRHPHPQ